MTNYADTTQKTSCTTYASRLSRITNQEYSQNAESKVGSFLYILIISYKFCLFASQTHNLIFALNGLVLLS